MSEGNLGPTKRFVPSGVDAQSWIGFEHRIQERRFKALLETINAAVARRDGVTARVALEEARELRPGTPELEALAARVALLPVAAAASGSSAYAWYRGLSAVAMFVVGVGLVIGIESMRSGDDTVTTAKPVVLALAPAPAVAAPIATSIDAAPAPLDTTPVTDAGPVAAVDVRSPAESLDAPKIVVDPKREEPVGTAGVSRAANAGAAAAAAPNRTTFREASAEPVQPVLPASREIPDDYVAQGTRREGRTGITETPASTTAFAANVMPQPVSITAPPPVLPATAAGVLPSVTPRSDNSRVTQVLNQYARAYGQLDPTAARAVWPTVDERALARAFASLESQDVSFDKCDIDVKGSLASASCSGTASYVGKVGSRQARTEARQWNFELKLHGDDWKIEKAQTLTR